MKRKMQTNQNKRRRVRDTTSQYVDVFLETVNQPLSLSDGQARINTRIIENRDEAMQPFQLIFRIYLNMFDQILNEDMVYNFDIFYENVPVMFDFTRQFDVNSIFTLFSSLFKRKNLLKREDLRKVKIDKYRKGTINEECSICMENFKTNQRIRTLECTHFFHSKCVDGWFLNYDDRCPICRTEIIKKEDVVPVKK